MSIEVKIIDHAGGDISVVNSARVSFNKEVSSVEPNDEKLINYLAKHKHMTPFRHNFIQLRCKVPLFLARQLMKHQSGLTWNEESRRYIDSPPEFYVPEGWRKRPDNSIKQGSGEGFVDVMYKDSLNQTTPEIEYAGHVHMCKTFYRNLLEEGVAPEQARMVLPQSMMVNFIWSGNLLAFFHVWNLRSGEGSQEEAKYFAELLDKEIEPHFPVSWKALKENK